MDTRKQKGRRLQGMDRDASCRVCGCIYAEQRTWLCDRRGRLIRCPVCNALPLNKDTACDKLRDGEERGAEAHDRIVSYDLSGVANTSAAKGKTHTLRRHK